MSTMQPYPLPFGLNTCEVRTATKFEPGQQKGKAIVAGIYHPLRLVKNSLLEIPVGTKLKVLERESLTLIAEVAQ